MIKCLNCENEIQEKDLIKSNDSYYCPICGDIIAEKCSICESIEPVQTVYVDENNNFYCEECWIQYEANQKGLI